MVANEVRELARGTAEATSEIGGLIQSIQTDTSSAIDAIGEISGVIESIQKQVTEIAAAVGAHGDKDRHHGDVFSRPVASGLGVCAPAALELTVALPVRFHRWSIDTAARD